MPGEYPSECTDQELEEEIGRLQEAVAQSGADAYSSSAIALIDAGLNERLRRTIEKESKASNRIALLALAVALLSVVASVVQLWSD